LWDGETPGFGCRIKPSGVKTFLVQYRVGARTRRLKIGRWPIWKVEQARRKAQKLLGEIDDGGDPSERQRRERLAKGNTVSAVASAFVDLHAKAKGRRRWRETERIFNVYVNPRIGARPISEIGRGDLVDLLDHVAKANGPVMANQVLAAVRRMFNWAIGRDLIQTTPVVGIERPGEVVKRQRILSDAEIRDVWTAAEAIDDAYGAFVKMLLVTGQRRSEVAGMRRSEIEDAVWTVPAERMKSGQRHEVPLSAAALAIIKTTEPKGDGDCVFTTSRLKGSPLASFGYIKTMLDCAILATRNSKSAGNKRQPEPLPRWTLHDLRRTMRTRLSKLGIDPEIAERVIGHVPGGVRGTYDLHQFQAEKRHALEAWAQSLMRIVAPIAEGNVVEMWHGQRSSLPPVDAEVRLN
jgi:integrase